VKKSTSSLWFAEFVLESFEILTGRFATTPEWTVNTTAYFPRNAIWTVTTNLCKFYGGKCIQMGGAAQIDVTQYIIGENPGYPYPGSYWFSASSNLQGVNLSDSYQYMDDYRDDDGNNIGYWQDKYGGYWDNRYGTWYDFYNQQYQTNQQKKQQQQEEEPEEAEDVAYYKQYNSYLNKYTYKKYSLNQYNQLYGEDGYKNGMVWTGERWEYPEGYEDQNAGGAGQEEEYEPTEYELRYRQRFYTLDEYLANTTRVVARFRFVPIADSYAYETITCDVPLKIVGANFNMEVYMRSYRYKSYHQQVQTAVATLGIVALLGLSAYGVRKRRLRTCEKTCGCAGDNNSDNCSIGEDATDFVLADMGKPNNPVSASASSENSV
jgi:hypothetical protein